MENKEKDIKLLEEELELYLGYKKNEIEKKHIEELIGDTTFEEIRLNRIVRYENRIQLIRNKLESLHSEK